MKLTHNIQIKVFCKEKEDAEEIKISLLSLLPYEDEELEKEKISIDEEDLDFEDGSRMTIFSVNLTKQKHLNKTIDHIFSLMEEDQKNFLIETLDTRMDENMNLYFRLDKGKLNSGECKIIDGGNCFHVKINIAAYPSKLEIARGLAESIIRNNQ